MSKILNRLLEPAESEPGPTEATDSAVILPFPKPAASRPSDSKPRLFPVTLLLSILVIWTAIQTWRHRRVEALTTVAPLTQKSALSENHLAVEAFYASNIEKSKTILERLVAENPRNAAVKINLGIVYRHLDRFDESQKLFEDALQLDTPNSAALDGLAQILVDEGQPLEAEKLFERSLSTGKNSPNTLLELGRIAEGRGRWDVASNYYARYRNHPLAQSVVSRLLTKRLEKIALGASIK